MSYQIVKQASSTIIRTLITFVLAAVGVGTGGLTSNSCAVEASVSIGVSCCVVEVTVELDLFLPSTPTIAPRGINGGGTGISGGGAVLPAMAAKLS